MSYLVLASTSRATDAGWLAAADIHTITAGLDVQYRLIGGLAVTLLVHEHGADGLAPQRETADADLGVSVETCGDRRFLPALLSAGYAQVQGNRLERATGSHTLVIDVLTPSYVGHLLPNQAHGELVVDEVPGLLTALVRPATPVDVTAVLTDGTELSTRLLLPDVTAALVMKALAYRGRFGTQDATDIHRLLEASNEAGRSVDDWPTNSESRDAAAVLHQFFGSARPSGHIGPAAARIRLLVRKLVPAPPR